ncbi:hypothetical protein BDY17DRAFT_256522 [Neohortaea acidophila]|uniref:NAD(P)-binding protein n=1 Tax=Neohortaea acidophila TaxID=245834 RepID=A0A6A6PJ49_9PEZI|nr:uncharacterized protein BDY17DRAFT_256522 [Neohortaea acidophila]KAF2479816.1 hypothetical protein BDY17DRAFT_256522 [Neohortaea acidophila]
MSELSDIKVTDRFSLTGKAFVITGGARGIGFATAKAIAQLGGSVALIDVLDKPVDEFDTLTKRFNVKASYQRADITDQKSLETAFDESVKAMGGQIHGGVCGAGININQPLIEADWDYSLKLLQVNLMGTYWTAKLIAKHLAETKTPGSIVCIASLSGQGIHIPVQDAAIYNASKAGIKGMMGPLAVELGKYGIRINSVSPGAIHSPMTASLEQDAPQLLKWFKDAAPVQRMGVPEDITPTICLLLSDAGAFTTGADMVITGGIHAGRNDFVLPGEGAQWLQSATK